MADYVPGIPQQPILLTIDGNGFLVLRTNSLMVDGIPSTEVVMSPFDWTKNKLKMEDAELDVSEDSYGTIRRTYHTSSIFPLSMNPEKPIWLLLCGFNGEEINIDNPSLLPIIKMKGELDSKDKRIERLSAEVEKLRNDNRELITLNTSYIEKMKNIVGEKIVAPLPEELLGMKISEKGVKR